MKNMIAALALLATLHAAPAQALPENVPPPLAFEMAVDTVTIVNVSLSTYNFTSITGLSGGTYIVVQSTGKTNFCCSFEASASSNTTAGIPGCIQGSKDPGGDFYERAFKRWARDLTLRCTSYIQSAGGIVRVLQGR